MSIGGRRQCLDGSISAVPTPGEAKGDTWLSKDHGYRKKPRERLKTLTADLNGTHPQGRVMFMAWTIRTSRNASRRNFVIYNKRMHTRNRASVTTGLAEHPMKDGSFACDKSWKICLG